MTWKPQIEKFVACTQNHHTLEQLMKKLHDYCATPRKEITMPTPSDKPPIIITVSGGLIQDIENIPPGIVIEVRDYDSHDEDGFNDCLISEWCGDPLPPQSPSANTPPTRESAAD